MQTSTLIALVLILALSCYFYARHRAFILARQRSSGTRSSAERKRGRRLHSLPSQYGYLVALWCALPALALIILWKLFEPTILEGMVQSSLSSGIGTELQDERSRSLFMNDVKNLIASDQWRDEEDASKRAVAERLSSLRNISSIAMALACLLFVAGGLFIGLRQIKPDTRARNLVEGCIRFFLIVCASIAILTTLGIVMSVLFESLRFFQQVNFIEFITGTTWSPQTAIRADQVGSSGSFGAIPLFTGTLLISAIAMIVAVPLGLMSAIYLAEYASSRVRSIVKPLLEILAGIPTVVYGFFAALTVAPAVRNMGESIGLSVASESALAAGVVMGIMIIPFVSSLSDDVITAVPQSMRDGSLGLGATPSETIRNVVIPAALPGIVGSVLLAVSRAIGETMIVMMAAGLAAKLTANPLDAVTTVTVQIVTLLTGDQEFDSAKTLAAFALGLMLFVTTLLLNIVALYTVRRYREQYD